MHYGYVEIEAKPLGAPLVSGFWLYDSTPVEWTEIDIAELSAGVHEWRRSYNMNAHVFHSPGYRGTPEHHLAWPARWTAASDLAHDYHVLGLEWNADHVTWYVDGVVVRRLGNEHWHQPLFLNINLEANAWFGAVPSQATVHGAYRIRYVRAWTRAHR
jgi:beta-glucanase (GH16 family)